MTATERAAHRVDAHDWTVSEGLPDIDPVLDASDDVDGSFWHHVKSSARMANIVDGSALTTVCGARLAPGRPIVWHEPAGNQAVRHTCARCAMIRAYRFR